MTGRRAAVVRVLIDTSALLALSRARDQYHEVATDLAARHLGAGGRFAGTTLILGELHAHLVHLRGPAEARTVTRSLMADPAHEWLDVTADLVAAAVDAWLERYADQRFSLVDAVSFEVMGRHGLSHAFAFDRHFETAGFAVLR